MEHKVTKQNKNKIGLKDKMYFYHLSWRYMGLSIGVGTLYFLSMEHICEYLLHLIPKVNQKLQCKMSLSPQPPSLNLSNPKHRLRPHYLYLT